ncbi:MAG: hypothetical protein WBG61_13240 [Desulfobacterales bacterium]
MRRSPPLLSRLVLQERLVQAQPWLSHLQARNHHQDPKALKPQLPQCHLQAPLHRESPPRGI